MQYFLAKTDPDTYSIDDLAKEKKTVWDGVHNYQAIIYIGEMKPNDVVYIYHSQVKGGDGPGVVGLAKVISEPSENKKDPRKSKVVEIEFVKKFKKVVTLKEIKETGMFNDWLLIRQGRLSVVKAPDNFVKWISKMSL